MGSRVVNVGANALPTYDELVERIEKLEAQGAVRLDQLPIQELQQQLEQRWAPDGDTLLLPQSIGTDSLADAGITQEKVASDVVAFGPFTKMATSTVAIASGTTATISHGLGVTAVAVIFNVVGAGLIAGNSAIFNYAIPNSTQIQIHNPGSPTTLTFRWWAFA